MLAGHPVPDRNGLAAARKLLDLATSAGPDDLAFVLISGGASAMTPRAGARPFSRGHPEDDPASPRIGRAHP